VNRERSMLHAGNCTLIFFASHCCLQLGTVVREAFVLITRAFPACKIVWTPHKSESMAPGKKDWQPTWAFPCTERSDFAARKHRFR
jgi:hypothetical protein